jgi:hypothetical protein
MAGEEPTDAEIEALAEKVKAELPLRPNGLLDHTTARREAMHDPGDAEYEKAFRARLDAEDEARQRAKKGLAG